MENHKDEIKEKLDQTENYKEFLFRRGYLLTDETLDVSVYPFYNLWSVHNVDNTPYRFYVHHSQDFTIFTKDNLSIAIVGHAYNPFTMDYKEESILKECHSAWKESKESFFDKVNELTGIHAIFLFERHNILAVQDCCGYKTCYFGKIKGRIYLTSHPQLVGDLNNLKLDKFVEKLFENKYYNIGNKYLPGNISPFTELKRLGANTYLFYNQKTFTVQRFFPLVAHPTFSTDAEILQVIASAKDILHNNIELTSRKWKNPAISLSGGIDSRTILACTNGLYDKFKYFSFHCKPQEKVDCIAAAKICKKINLEHKTYPIPDNNEDFVDFDFYLKLDRHNAAYQKLSDHELRKKIYLTKLNDFDVELKGWSSEIARVFFDRKYSMKMPDVFSPRHFSILQTRYFLSPRLLRKSDRLYFEFMNETNLMQPLFNYEHSDLNYWECRMGNWGAVVSTSFDLCHRITMPFNNRKLLVLMLGVPREKRIDDWMHKQIISLGDSRLSEIEEIENLYFTNKRRILMEKTYFIYKTFLLKKNKNE